VARLVGMEVHGQGLTDVWMFVPQRDAVRCDGCDFPQIEQGWVPESDRLVDVADEVASRMITITFDGFVLVSREGRQMLCDAGLDDDDFVEVSDRVWTLNYSTTEAIEPVLRHARDVNSCDVCGRPLRREIVDFGDERDRISVVAAPAGSMFRLTGLFGRRDLWRPVVMVTPAVFQQVRRHCKVRAGWRAVV